MQTGWFKEVHFKDIDSHSVRALLASRAMLIKIKRDLNGGKRCPCRDDGDGEFVRFFASARKADRDCNIEPPASPYAIMRRAHPYRGENSGPGKNIVEKLDTQTRN